MRVQQTIQIIIESDKDLQDTLVQFTKVKQDLSPVCFNKGNILSQLALHKHSYQFIKGTLNAQMTCSAIRLVAASYVSARKNKHKIDKPFNFKKHSALFLIGTRGRDASFKKGKLSIWTVAGRKQLHYIIPEYFHQTFKDAVSIDSLNVVERNNKLIGYICITLEYPEPVGILPVGVDLNETNVLVAVDPDNKEFFKSGLTHKVANTKTRKTHKRVKAKLTTLKAEKKDTRSVRRLLKRLSRKQSNRTDNFCKTTAKQFIQWCPDNAVIVLEDLKIPQVSKDSPAKKGIKRRLSQWARGQLTNRIEANALKKGITVVRVNPYNTSQICSHCGLIGNRHRHKFVCPHCNHNMHSDLNAAVNIRNRYTTSRSSGLTSISPETLPPGEGKLPA